MNFFLASSVAAKRHHHRKPQLHQRCSTQSPAETQTQTQNPFSYLSSLPPPLAVKTIDSVLQSTLHLRPRSLSHPIYCSLLSSTLPDPNSNPRIPTSLLPLALAVLQSSARSGFHPPPKTRSSLAALWVHFRRRHHRLPISRLLSSVNAIGYSLDLNTCNYLISSLCSVSETEEAVGVLQGIRLVGCVPDSECYCRVVEALCRDGRVEVGNELVRYMVVREGMVPKRGVVGRVVATMRKVGEVRRAVEVVRLVERVGWRVEFEGYESLVEGCLERGDVVLAGKGVVEMAKRGFVPHLKLRRRVVDGLAGVGQHELAGHVRHRLADIGS